MLGTAIQSVAAQSKYEIISVTGSQMRHGGVMNSPYAFLEALELGPQDVVINASGRTKHSPGVEVRAPHMFLINSTFPQLLGKLAEARGYRVVQPGTDCVFAGHKGIKNETSFHDATDLYGVSKSLGEVASRAVTIVRSSFVGFTPFATSGQLGDWLAGHPPESKIQGYTNHLWSGVPVKVLAYVMAGVAVNPSFPSGTFHLVPNGFLRKSELLRILCRHLNRTDIVVQDVESKNQVDRVLSTAFPEQNKAMFSELGFGEVPSIEELFEMEF